MPVETSPCMLWGLHTKPIIELHDEDVLSLGIEDGTEVIAQAKSAVVQSVPSALLPDEEDCGAWSVFPSKYHVHSQ